MANNSSAATPATKGNRHHHEAEDHLIIPSLPNPMAQQCLSLVHPSILYSVCRSWRCLIYSPSFPPFLSLYAILSTSPSPPQTTLKTRDHHNSSSIHFYNFDPISSNWHVLPPTPSDPPLHLLHRHPSFLSRNFPIQSITVNGNLILLAATTHNLCAALPRPLIFNPISQNWIFGPTLATPRRWCALGAYRGIIYVASGIGTQFSKDVARSLEKWDMRKNVNHHKWEKKMSMKDGRFSRDAIDAVGWRGKLCMVNGMKEGVVYDVEKDLWVEMPKGMLSGWKGPVAAMEEEVMYVVDEVKGVVRKYVAEEDGWEDVMECERLKGAEKLTAKGGRVCVVSGSGAVSVVDVVASPAKLWVVELPEGFEAVAVHVLPRMPLMPVPR